MDGPNTHERTPPSPTTTRRTRSSSHSNSPEFEFWMVRNPSLPHPILHSADELFVDGVLLPLHLRSNKPSESDPIPRRDPAPSDKDVPGEEAEDEAGPELRHVTGSRHPSGLTSSKRWKDIFKKDSNKTKSCTSAAVTTKSNNVEDSKQRRTETKKSQSGGATSSSSSSSAELNINIWPFSRSRSAGNGGIRPRFVAGDPFTRKVSSAPCSRSNSAGESKSRKWPSSPGRAGVQLGRGSRIWQVKRAAVAGGGGGGRGGGGGGGSGLAKNSEPEARSSEKVGSKTKKETRGRVVGNGSGNNKGTTTTTTGTAKVLNLNVNVPTCIGYRHHLSCRSDDNNAIGVISSSSSTGNDGGNRNSNSNSNSNSSVPNNLFNLRSLFAKKVY